MVGFFFDIVKLSCFSLISEMCEVFGGFKEGCIDIVVGMYCVVLCDVNFFNFGLLIIDEE